ncbi:related to YPD1 - two-component phosphorelay intermediate [Melanopsichium pennsylvanicum]|uniref:Related to YPD1 - two-component phosphorelay intermediate n=2 Tax=Melanopsichium pennsylvanicum TaxID=63383 RepID=A0AAJ4XS29_9BASI|nr:related to YPD1-two-component phosphorelay intermediate [Melanopsichium pennsylvanicum 4]SNX86856.1 related to YPD1 - two-component phosphorelay intermediate [Melanopsichium pennsylvanicum]
MPAPDTPDMDLSATPLSVASHSKSANVAASPAMSAKTSITNPPIVTLPPFSPLELNLDDHHIQQGADGASGSAGDLSPTIIDMDIFSQLLEMDDEDDREFSKSIVWNYFDQAETTFKEMDAALSKENLTELSTLGHFLKGSSAAVGVIKVRDSCEHMQHYGKCHGEDGVSDLTQDEAMEKLTRTLRDVKVQYQEAAKALKAFYDEEGENDDNAEAEAEVEAQEEAATQEDAEADKVDEDKAEKVDEKAEKTEAGPVKTAA